jgi:hypothetical protein
MATRTILPTVIDLSGDLDGSTVTFSLSESFISGTLEVMINGLFLTPGTDFTEGNRSFTLTGEDAPASGENMVAKYFPAEAARSLSQEGYLSGLRQISDQYGTSRIIYD